MKTYHSKIIILLVICSSVLSCSNAGSPSDADDTSDLFIENLKNSLEEIPAESSHYFIPETVYQPSWMLSVNNCEQFLVVDRADNTISQLDSSRDLISTAGGEGRGPGEFQGIIGPQIGSDNRLYIIDGLEFRISIYEIEENQLEFIKSVPFKNPSNHYLFTLYVTEFGKFGVYQDSEGYLTPDNQYLLYRLDENFEPIELLLEMPGNERQKFENPEFTLYTPYQYLSRTNWDVENGWFYYMTTINPTIHKYNMESGEKVEISFFQPGERENTLEFTQAVLEYYDPDAEDYWAALNDIEKLPLFTGFIADEERIYLKILPFPGDDSMTIVLDQETEDVAFFSNPTGFDLKASCDNTLFGVDYRIDEDPRMMVFDLINY